MAVARQPSQIRPERLIQVPDQPELPPHCRADPRGEREDLGSLLTDETFRPDIDHHAGAVGQPGEVVRGVFTIPLAIRPDQMEGLGGQSDDGGIEVQGHRGVPLHPRLVTHQVTRGRRPVVTSEVLLPLERDELPGWRGQFERLGPVAGQWTEPCGAVGTDEPDLDVRRVLPGRCRLRGLAHEHLLATLAPALRGWNTQRGLMSRTWKASPQRATSL